MIKAQIFYNDDKNIIVNIEEEDCERFLLCLKDNYVFWENSKKSGVWVNTNSIRYVTFSVENIESTPPAPSSESLDNDHLNEPDQE